MTEEKKNQVPIRAFTYQLVARGPCQFCGTITELRFVYNPYGDDRLVCEDCGERWDSQFETDAKGVR